MNIKIDMETKPCVCFGVKTEYNKKTGSRACEQCGFNFDCKTKIKKTRGF